MIVLDKKLNLFVWSLIIVSLAGKSHQDLWWKNSRIVRQGSYGNMPQPPVNPQPQRPSVPQEPQFVPTVQEQTITGISFDCSNKPTGPNKDSQYCDIYHACVFGKQEKTYGCAQNGDRFYYDETTQKCEFASKNPSGCPSGNYFTPLTQTDNQQQSMNSGYGNNNNNNNNNFGTYGQVPSGGNNNNNNYNYQQTNFMPQTTQPVFFTQPFNQYGNQNNMGNNNNFQPSGQVEQVEPWKQYVRDNEQFSCADKPDGFYPSKWCNVYYRCFNKNKFEFLCAVMQSGDRLWWKLHSTSQSVPQPQAQCEWPCDTGRQCTSPGGILIDNGSSVSESTSEAQRVLDSCPKPSGNNNNQQTGGYGQVPSGGNNNNNNQQIGGYGQGSNDFISYGQVPSGGNNNNNNMGNYGQGSNGGNGQVVEDNSNDLFRIPDSENPCQGVSDGSFVADSKYCNVFHVCVKGVRKDFLCAKGSSTYELWWNDATKQCDWPCKVQCSKQIFGSSSSAAEVANMDRNLNPALCGADQGSNGNNGNQFGAYGNQFTQPPIQTLPPQTYPPQTYPPQTYPPQTYPPQTYPPQTYPPQTYPPQTYPPQTQPPQTYPSYNNNNNNNYGGYGF